MYIFMCDYAFACLDRPWDHWRAGHVLETFARGREEGRRTLFACDDDV